MAASFHRDLFEELDECGIPLKVSVLKHAEKMLSLISDFKDPFLQKYWLRALGYPLFSLLNPDGEEVQNLREKFPDFRLRATRWGRMIHKKEQNYTIQDTDETIAIPTRMLRQAMMPYYYHQRE